MSVSISPQRVRLAVNVAKKTIGVDVLTAATARILKPADVQFEIALFADDGVTLLDLSGLASLKLQVKPESPRTAAAKLSATQTSGGFNNALTIEEWEAGLPESCHALFQFSATDTNFDLGEDQVIFYVVLSGLTDGDPAKPLVFANGKLVIEESGVKL